MIVLDLLLIDVGIIPSGIEGADHRVMSGHQSGQIFFAVNVAFLRMKVCVRLGAPHISWSMRDAARLSEDR